LDTTTLTNDDDDENDETKDDQASIPDTYYDQCDNNLTIENTEKMVQELPKKQQQQHLANISHDEEDTTKVAEKKQQRWGLELIVILLIFCLILWALNVMWNNFFTTMLILCLTLPILRWMGKI
jgi:hypothetical protein